MDRLDRWDGTGVRLRLIRSGGELAAGEGVVRGVREGRDGYFYMGIGVANVYVCIVKYLF